LRAWILVVGMVAALLAMPLNASAATTVRMSDLHVSLELPTGWTYERNSSSGGLIYDLEIQGPTSGGYQPYGLLDHMSWPGSVSDSSLWAEMKRERDDMRQDPDITSSVIISPGVNGTLNGVKSNTMTIDMTYSGLTIRTRMVIIASDAWNMGWKFAIASVSSQWSMYSSQIDSIINSLTVSEKTGTDQSMLFAGVGILIVVVVVILVVVLALRKREKRQEMPPAPPPIQPPGQPPMQPPLQPPIPPPPNP
jgi:hypothetical protein